MAGATFPDRQHTRYRADRELQREPAEATPVAVVERWIPLLDVSDIVLARSEGRRLATEAGFGGTDLTVIATAASAVARTLFRCAGSGIVRLSIVEESGRRGIRMDGNGSIAAGATSGVAKGLAGVRRLMDRFVLRQRADLSVKVVMWKWLRRPFGGERAALAAVSSHNPSVGQAHVGA